MSKKTADSNVWGAAGYSREGDRGRERMRTMVAMSGNKEADLDAAFKGLQSEVRVIANGRYKELRSQGVAPGEAAARARRDAKRLWDAMVKRAVQTKKTTGGAFVCRTRVLGGRVVKS